MLDIVAADKQKLALAVQVEILDEAQAQLPRALAARQAAAQFHEDFHHMQQQDDENDESQAGTDPGHQGMATQKLVHQPRTLLCNIALNYNATSVPLRAKG